MKKLALVTGSAGLVGSECVRFFSQKGFGVIGVDNNMRKNFFGDAASVEWNKALLLKTAPGYVHYDFDIRDKAAVESLFTKYNFDLIIHAAAQPSHDWAAKEPSTDFDINAGGTQILLENFRARAPGAVFIFLSTNKVYGDNPNRLPLVELDKRFELPESHTFYGGIDESFSIDNCLHSLFGASKAAADILVQEYGKYFGLKTAAFRCGCITGPYHSGAELHGFLSYLVKCCISGKKYTIFGYKGKQVRDNIHSRDLVEAFYQFYLKPRSGEVYNMGGGRSASVSVLEAIGICEAVSGRNMSHEYVDRNRIGDHIWRISSLSKFKSHYPGWKISYDARGLIQDIFTQQKEFAGDK